MYNKLEEQEYASMVHCLRRESYRNTQQAEEEAVLEQGLHPLEVELPAKAPVTETQKWKPARKRESCESTPDFLLQRRNPREPFLLLEEACRPRAEV